jgi:NAD(P)-dependent dehydrogenase (short-subunit alcohol dehydrogenase family)
MKGKTVLVTGATDGIGRQVALELSQRGAHVIVHGRNPERGQQVVADIQRQTDSQIVEYANADFTTVHAARDLAHHVERRCERLDILINNAGLYAERRTMTPDGLELTFAVNHLAAFVVTTGLIDLLQRSRPARIITVSSGTHHSARLDVSDLQSERRYDGYQAYARSKLCSILFTYHLARLLSDSGVTANCLHPGGINTKLLRAGFGGGGRSVVEGARTPVYLATAPGVEHVTGQYFVDEKPARSSVLSYDHGLQEQLWSLSDRLAAEALARSG